MRGLHYGIGRVASNIAGLAGLPRRSIEHVGENKMSLLCSQGESCSWGMIFLSFLSFLGFEDAA
jgi:hypothetical protein